jgi:hypothetical protein
VSRSWAKGSTTAWRRTRAAVLAANANQNKGRCQLDVGQGCARHGRPCPGVCTGRANTVHHTKGKAHGDDVRYLVAACAECNGHVGNPMDYNPEPTPRSRW